MSGELLFWLNLLVTVGIYTLLAVSLNLINGSAGMFHLGHHGFWALGAYAATWLTINCPSLPGPLLFVLSLLLAMAVAALGGLTIGIPCLRLRGDYLAIATLGFGEIVRIAVQNSPPRFLGGSLGIEVPRILMKVTPKTVVPFRLLVLGIVAVACAAAIVTFRNFLTSLPGRRLLAVAQDETAAGLLGIDPTRSKVLAFVMGSAVAGLAGGLFAHYMGGINPLNFSFMEMVKMFLIIVLSGLGSLSGCVVGAFLVVATEQLLNRAPEAIASWWQVEFPLLLALMIIFRPQGIFGRREIGDVIRAWRKAPA
ncbi:MAG TPA: branched-chain amino acid ABC transporter permease [Planctomycetota bacterium]|nr:branched-chain amino acid ABC transporter permease [Planctomycetota bacterium]